MEGCLLQQQAFFVADGCSRLPLVVFDSVESISGSGDSEMKWPPEIIWYCRHSQECSLETDAISSTVVVSRNSALSQAGSRARVISEETLDSTPIV